MHPGDTPIDHQVFQVLVRRQDFEDTRPIALLRPAIVAHINTMPVAEFFRQIPPRRSRTVDPQNRLEKPAIVSGRDTAIHRLAGQMVFDTLPLIISEYGTSHISSSGKARKITQNRTDSQLRTPPRKWKRVGVGDAEIQFLLPSNDE